jgi:class 3 adenylate cyclase/tetratricopeptide (TPR) repeat protein
LSEAFQASSICLKAFETTAGFGNSHMNMTFMFTDIEGSTRKWQLYPEKMAEALSEHDRIVRKELDRFSGREVKHTGDGFMVIFRNGRALECALSLQRKFVGNDWSSVDGLKVRIGIGSGRATEQRGDYFGEAVNRTARLMSAGCGGQVVVGPSAAKSEIQPSGSDLTDCGVHMLRDLMKPLQLFTLSHPDINSEFPPLSTVSSSPHNLPVQPTMFVGRQKELAQISDLLLRSGNRVVTLLGYGGAGKTRTSLQVAANNSLQFRHGVWFVPLENADGEASILSTMAESMSFGFSGSGSAEEQLIEFLSDRETLLVLDNFEHLTNHSALVSRLLAESPGLRILVTSRQRLGIREEAVFDLSGMMLPEERMSDIEGCDSADLFLNSARRIYQSFAPDEKDKESIGHICRILDGLPLALELAAPWVRTISCAKLEMELRSSLEILESTAADRPERQRSIEAVFLYSWDLLNEMEKEALAGLSVFEKDFTLEAAKEVAGCSLKTLRNLCDRSLVKSGENMFAIHPLTRELAAGYQYLIPDLDEKHVKFFHHFAEELKPQISSSDQADALDRMSSAFPDIKKAAVNSFRNMNTELMDSFISLLSPLLQLRSRFGEGLEIYTGLQRELEKAARISDINREYLLATTARLKERTAVFLLMTGKRKEAEECLSEAARLSVSMNDPGFSTLCLAGLGNMAYMNEDLEDSEKYWSEALQITKSSGSSSSEASLLCNLSGVYRKQGNLTKASELLCEAREIITLMGDVFLNASVLSKLGDIAVLEGKFDDAENCFRESLSLNMKVGNHRGASYCLECLASVERKISAGDGISLAEEAVELAVRSGTATRIITARFVLAEYLAEKGRLKESLDQLDRADEEAGKLDLPKHRTKGAHLRASISRTLECQEDSPDTIV